MTDSSIIQDARDVLAKWRRLTSRDPWKASGDAVRDSAGGPIVDYADVKNIEARRAALANVTLIVGTAGNPELLDAIDAVLADAQEALADIEATGSGALASLINITGGGRHRNALRIAAAIIAADERMSA